MNENSRSSGERPQTVRRRWRLAIPFVAAALIVIVAGTLITRLDLRQNTLYSWAQAQAVADQIDAIDGWAIVDEYPPCGNADPEAFILLEADTPSQAHVRLVEEGLRRKEWTVTIPVGSASSDAAFSASSADGDVRVVIDTAESRLQAEVSIIERC